MAPTIGEGTALVVVDMQNDFVRPGAPMEVPTALVTLPRIARLAAAFRDMGLTVIYTRFIAAPRETLLWRWSPQCAPPVCACWRGIARRYDDVSDERDGSAIVDELTPLPGDEVVEKYLYDSFHNSTLEDVLHAHQIGSVVVVGTVTQICVADTVHGAFHRGFEAVAVDDATSSFDEAQHRAVLQNISLKYGWVMSTDEVLARLNSLGQTAGKQIITKEERPWTAA
jgi:nicotinamidase-related amidase